MERNAKKTYGYPFSIEVRSGTGCGAEWWVILFGSPFTGAGEEFLYHSTEVKNIWIPMGDIYAN